jgi:cell wall-associated protease
MKKFLVLILFFQSGVIGIGQTSLPKPKQNGWHLLDKQSDGYLGISLQKAYELLKGKKSTTVIVAVIDSGIDTVQEDLKDVLWRNPKEISGNGLDDDGNGYADDIHGWNFCGAKNGENLSRNSHEITRVYHNWKSEFEGKTAKDPIY